MKTEDAKEIIACLPKGRTVYPYHRDRYAVQLLEFVVDDGVSISELRSSDFGKLLCRPAVKNVVASCGSGNLSRDDLAKAWPLDVEVYRLSLTRWGPECEKDWDRWGYQTSRPGQNLVLQLNFSNAHNEAYGRIVKSKNNSPFAFYGHPVVQRDWHTLAWARLDIDLDGGSALIEELQSDWVRYSRTAAEYAQKVLTGANGEEPQKDIVFDGQTMDAKAVCAYYRDVVAPHAKLWDEAMLSAAIWFLVSELGIGQIYLHDHETGCKLKNVTFSQPPRSLYTKLPQRFCFQKIKQGPDFLFEKPDRRLRKLMKSEDLAFWRLVI